MPVVSSPPEPRSRTWPDRRPCQISATPASFACALTLVRPVWASWIRIVPFSVPTPFSTLTITWTENVTLPDSLGSPVDSRHRDELLCVLAVDPFAGAGLALDV